MKITFLISDMSVGGAQRVVSLMANHWAAAGHAITIVTVSDTPSFYPLEPEIEWIGLGLQREPGSLLSGLKANIKRIRSVRKTLLALKPNMVISFLTQTNIVAAAACRSLALPVIVCERNNPEQGTLSRSWKRARKTAYQWADRIVVQTESARRFYDNFSAETVVIPNPVRKMTVAEHKKENIILAAGRLVPQKGFDLLIDAFANVSAADWQLVILGEGPERDNLEKQVSDLSLSGRVQLPGQVKDIDAFYAKAPIFVLSSRFEGFPNVLCEAMAAGLACISCDCASGPADIIDHNQNGLLVETENETALAAAINALIYNQNKRDSLGKAAAKISEKLALNKIMARWDDTLAELTGNR